MRTKLIPLLVAALMLLSACSSTNDSAPDSKTEPEGPANASPVVPDGYRLAEDGESPDAYINEDGSIITAPYGDDGEVNPDLWGVKSENAYEDETPDGMGGLYDYLDPDGDGVITGREAGLRYFEYGCMDPDRQAYRLSCLTEGVNLSTPSQTKGSFPEIYDEVMRNIYDYYGYDCAVTGEVDFIERTGSYTLMIVKIQLLYSELYVIADVNTDIGVIKGDTITIFGDYAGPATYTSTNQYGAVTENDTFRISIQDFYLGNARAEAESEFIPGAPTLTEEERAYWYKTYDSGFGLTDNGVVLRDGTIATYTVAQYAYDPEFGSYTIYFRYDDLADSYPENVYTILYLTYTSPKFYMSESEDHALYNATYQTSHSSVDYPTRTHTTTSTYRWNVLDAY